MTDTTTEAEQDADPQGRNKALVSCDELKEICELTVKLTELRQKECKHLSIEDYAPEVFFVLLSKMAAHKRGFVSLLPDVKLSDVEPEWFRRYSS